MLTKEQRIDMIDDLEDNQCTSTLASVARLLIEEKEILQKEIDRMKAMKRTDPCEWCKDVGCGDVTQVLASLDIRHEVDPDDDVWGEAHYCPNCGRKLEGEIR